MWSYDKRLIHPVKVKKPDPMSASIIITPVSYTHLDVYKRQGLPECIGGYKSTD